MDWEDFLVTGKACKAILRITLGHQGINKALPTFFTASVHMLESMLSAHMATNTERWFTTFFLQPLP